MKGFKRCWKELRMITAFREETLETFSITNTALQGNIKVIFKNIALFWNKIFEGRIKRSATEVAAKQSHSVKLIQKNMQFTEVDVQNIGSARGENYWPSFQKYSCGA